jgi:hypothetical protein
MPRALPALLLLLALSGCHGPAPAAPRRPTATLAVRCAVAEADVFIDEVYAGEVRDLGGGVRLPAGAHRVEVRHEGHHPRYLDVRLEPGETRRLEVHLAEILP